MRALLLTDEEIDYLKIVFTNKISALGVKIDRAINNSANIDNFKEHLEDIETERKLNRGILNKLK
jgi:hypothetical protein